MSTHRQEDRLELVNVYTSNGPLGAEVVKSKLESAGIPVLLRSEAQSVFALTIDGMGEVRVMVPKEREQEARELLKEEDTERGGEEDEEEEKE